MCVYVYFCMTSKQYIIVIKRGIEGEKTDQIVQLCTKYLPSEIFIHENGTNQFRGERESGCWVIVLGSNTKMTKEEFPY